jgi:RNA polymerase sigma factor (sigma-70 family)
VTRFAFMPSPTTVLLRTQTDERLVALARAGSERAFEAIVERYRRPLVRACRRVLPEARAEDAVQQALMAAWAALQRGDEVRELRPWLYRIAHNTALNQLRVSGYDYDELHGLLDTGPAPEEELERRDVARRTLTGLAALPERQREALLQIAVHGRGQEEVAEALGISEPAVRQLVHRARSRLRAAATAVIPMPVAGWLAELGSRADLVAGGGVAATVAKVGAVVVLAGGGAAAGPGVVSRLEHGGASRGGAATANAADVPRSAAAALGSPARVASGSSPHGSSRGPSGGDDSRGPGSRGSSGGDDSRHSAGSAESGGEDRGSSGGDDGSDGGASHSGSSHSGSSDGGSSHSGSSRRDSSDDSGSHDSSGDESPDSAGGPRHSSGSDDWGGSSGGDSPASSGGGDSRDSSGDDSLASPSDDSPDSPGGDSPDASGGAHSGGSSGGDAAPDDSHDAAVPAGPTPSDDSSIRELDRAAATPTPVLDAEPGAR